MAGCYQSTLSIFSITGGRERWLYRVARKHAGGAGEEGFTISLPTLFGKSGAEGTYRRFKFEILAIARKKRTSGLRPRAGNLRQGAEAAHEPPRCRPAGAGDTDTFQGRSARANATRAADTDARHAALQPSIDRRKHWRGSGAIFRCGMFMRSRPSSTHGLPTVDTSPMTIRRLSTASCANTTLTTNLPDPPPDRERS